MIQILLLISRNTMKDAIRQKVLYGAIAFALVFALLSFAMRSLTLGAEQRLMLNSGLFGTSVLGVAIAIFLGVNSLYMELERKTIYTVLSRPIPRPLFIMGKYLGLVGTLTLAMFMMVGIIFLGMWATDLEITSSTLLVCGLLILETWVILAVSLFFSSFSSPFLSGIFTVGIVVIGRLAHDINLFMERLTSGASTSAKLIMQVFPDFKIFHVEPYLLAGDPVQFNYFAWCAGYAALYIGVTLIISMFLFNRRDFI